MANVTPQAVSTRRERVAWYLYDFGNSAYAAVVLLAVYSAYFQKQVVGGAEGSRLWGLTISVAMILVAIAAPIMGAIADYSGAKKRFLFFFTALSVLFTALLFFTESGTVALAIGFFLLAEIGYRAAQIFYDALLPEIAAPAEMGRIAGTGWAVGSAGGIVILLLILPPILMTDSSLIVVRGTLVATAIFFALAATPIFLRLRERAQPQKLPPGENYLNIAFKQLKETIRAARGFKEFLKFMLAYLIYNEGVIIALDFAAILGAALTVFFTYYHVVAGADAGSLIDSRIMGRLSIYGDAWPDHPAGDFALIREPLDFLGVNYYTRGIARSRAIPEAENESPTITRGAEITEMGWEVYPEGLLNLLGRLHIDYAFPAIYVTENGAAFADEVGPDGQVDDPDRLSYLRRHLEMVKRAIHLGAPVKGYFAWALLDNFEWGFGFSKRFGVVHVDFTTQQRIPKTSARWYRQVILENGSALGA